MGRRGFRICAAALAAVIGILIWMNVEAAKGLEPDAVFPMANRGIEWTGAGYSGIYDN